MSPTLTWLHCACVCVCLLACLFSWTNQLLKISMSAFKSPWPHAQISVCKTIELAWKRPWAKAMWIEVHTVTYFLFPQATWTIPWQTVKTGFQSVIHVSWWRWSVMHEWCSFTAKTQLIIWVWTLTYTCVAALANKPSHMVSASWISGVLLAQAHSDQASS